jgi:transglutaminase-like putative cysteine protease
MRIKITHETTFAYAAPVRSIIQNLRLTPRSFDSQYVMRWRVGVDIDGTLRLNEDSLGNVVHSFSYQRPVERFTVSAIGEVETTDAVGVVRGAVETLPAQMFLRASALAQANGTLRDFVGAAIAGVADPLERLHAIMGALHREIAYDAEATPSKAGAAEALAMKRGGAPDFAHVFIAAARWLEIPARYVTGYVAPGEGEAPRGLFAWAEAEAPRLGWVAFDAVHDLCADDRYVRVAVGFDALSAAPFRGSHGSGGDEEVTTAVWIEPAMGQGQGQRQQ